MSTQSTVQHHTKQSSINPSLISNAINSNLFHPQKSIELLNPLDIPISEVRVHHLKSKSDIQEIQYLRSEINLDVHRANDPHFSELEKKEMN